jgi:hypothetical protein
MEFITVQIPSRATSALASSGAETCRSYGACWFRQVRGYKHGAPNGAFAVGRSAASDSLSDAIVRPTRNHRGKDVAPPGSVRIAMFVDLCRSRITAH